MLPHPPDISLVMVAFGSSGVLPRAAESFRAEAARAGVTAEVVVVDHSEDEQEAVRLLAARPDVLLRNPNRGYAAGLNAGADAARGAVLLAANPDIRFEVDSLARLLAALRAGWHVVAPQLTLGRLHYPAAEEQQPSAEWGRWLAHRGPRLQHWWWRRELLRWKRQWQAAAPVPQTFLCGALVASSREVWRRIGPWDECYFLYFEETDWLLRANRAGFRSAVVPGALVEHEWGHAALPEDAGGRFAVSRRRYLRRNFGPAGSLAARLAIPRPWRRPWPDLPEEGIPGPDREVLWLVSPLQVGLSSLAFWGGNEPPWDALRRVAAPQRGLRELTVAAVAGQRRLGCWRWRCEGIRHGG